MKFLKIFGLVIITILLSTVGLLFFWGSGLNNTVLNQDYYQKVFQETDLISNLHQGLEENLSEMMVPDDEDDDMPEEMEEILDDILGTLLNVYDAEWFADKLTNAVDDLFAFINQEKTELVIEIDLTERKDQFVDELNQYFQDYSDEELADMEIERAEISEFVDEIVEDMEFLNEPIVIDLADEEMEELNEVLQEVNSYRTLFFVISIAFIALLIGLVFLILKLTKGLTFLGIVFSIISLLFIFKMLAISFVVAPLIAEEIEVDFILQEDIQTLIDVTVKNFLIAPIVILVIGIAMIVTAIVLKKKNKSGDDFLADEPRKPMPEIKKEEPKKDDSEK